MLIIIMDKLYLGMGCFWSTQFLFNEKFPHLSNEVGYSKEGIEVLAVDVPDIKELERIVAFFFENQSFNTQRPPKYQSVLFYENQQHLSHLIYGFNRYNNSIKSAGRLGMSNAKILALDAYKKADDHQQHYLIHHPTVKCHLGFNGVYY